MTNLIANTYGDILQKQKYFFNTSGIQSISFRKKQLNILLSIIETHEDRLLASIYLDLRKSKFEAISTELGLLKAEINYTLSHLHQWTARTYVPTPLANFPASSYIQAEPLGCILVIGAWNYPYLLTLQPVISALAAGNTVILKPSEKAVHCAKLLTDLIHSHFDSRVFCVIEAGVSQTTEILKLKFDKIFFTGSAKVGKIIYKAAAEQLTPVTLELGGKSPAIICADVKINTAAKRIVWGKFLNAGQTCVAPDYLYIDEKIKNDFISALIRQITYMYGERPDESNIYGRMINIDHFNHVKKLIPAQKVIFGGDTHIEDLYIAPTLIDRVTWEEPIMREEIFGPLLPILTYQNIDEVITQIKGQPKPLSLYLFTSKNKIKERILSALPFGSGAINDTVVQLINPHLPFGGIGDSGIGAYHGKYGFDNFSHHKSIHEKPMGFEFPFKYPPYTKFKMKLLRWILT